jgi:hypothetical protein
MTERPSFINVYLDAIFEMPIAVGILGFILTPLVYLFFLRLSKPKKEKENGLDKKQKNKFILYILDAIIMFIPMMLVILSVTMTSQSKIDSDNYFVATVNAEWFNNNSEAIYNELEKKEYKDIKIQSIEEINRKNYENYDTKYKLMIESLEEFKGKKIYLIKATVRNGNKKEEKVKMLVTLTKGKDSEPVKAYLKDTKNSKYDVGEGVLYGEMYVSKEIKELFE